MSNPVDVSVIVPLYNKASTVGRCLTSILAQSFEGFEVVVVDDGSEDRGAEIVRQFKDRRLRLIRQENRGPGGARNRGLAEAAGRLAAFLDADDEWHPRYLERQRELLDEAGTDATSVGYVEYPFGRSREASWRNRGLEDRSYRLMPETDPRFAVTLLAYMSPWNTVARTETLRTLGGFYDRTRCLYGEDSYLWLKVLLNGSVHVSFEPLVGFHREASQLSSNLDTRRPVEPHLTDPDGLVATCPDHLRDLLTEILALRAAKTACLLGAWGERMEARRLLDRFSTRASRTGRLHGLARLLSSRPGSVLAPSARVAGRVLSSLPDAWASVVRAVGPRPLRPAPTDIRPALDPGAVLEIRACRTTRDSSGS